MAKATQLAKIDSSIKISNGLERRKTVKDNIYFKEKNNKAAGIKKRYLEKANLHAKNLVCLCRSYITGSCFTTS